MSETLCSIHLAQRDESLERKIQTSLKQRVSFHTVTLLRPIPPSFFGLQTFYQEILATFLPSILPYHINLEHKDSIFLKHPCGNKNVEIQKFTIPKITEDISWTRPAKDKFLTAQDLNLFDIFSNKGSYSDILSFLLIRGSRRYLIWRVPIG